MTYDVISLGLNAVDVLIRLPETVLKDDKQMVDSLIIQGGAPTATGAAAVARMGYHVGYVARLGQNTLSAIALEEFAGSNVDTQLVVQDENSKPALALVEIDPKNGARTVFIQMENYGYLKPADIPIDSIQKAKVILVDSYDLDATEIALKAAQGTNCKSVLDFESGDPDRLIELMQFGTEIILPLACAQKLSGLEDPAKVVEKLASMTPGQIIVTDGKQGSWGWDKATQSIIHQEILDAELADTTGCGDAFHAGCLVGLLEDWPLSMRMEFGTLIAAIVSTKVGGRSALPWKQDLMQILRSDLSPELTTAIKKLYENSI